MFRPVIAVFSGDPAGIGPEIVEKLLWLPGLAERARVVLIGQRGALQAPEWVQWHDWTCLHAQPFEPGCARADSGRYMLEGLDAGTRLVASGGADAFCFAPLNKGALRAGGMQQEDELRRFAELLDHRGVSGELSVLDRLWTARVTSHVPLSRVADLLTPEKVADAISMLYRALRSAGVGSPRIAVCGLNPHNGDHGNYGDEEFRIIAPGIRQAVQRGRPADGPFAADTVFVRATREYGGYDGVVTMYHDQGQIAMKLLGFERGVTVFGGLPIPITSPAHGTGYDIVGQGIANPGAMTAAFELAVRLGANRRLGYA